MSAPLAATVGNRIDVARAFAESGGKVPTGYRVATYHGEGPSLHYVIAEYGSAEAWMIVDTRATRDAADAAARLLNNDTEED